MSLIINAPDLEAELAGAAEKAGITAEVFALGICVALLNDRHNGAREHSPPPFETLEGVGPTLAEATAPFIGKYHSEGKRPMSQNPGEQFTDYFVEKRKNGNL